MREGMRECERELSAATEITFLAPAVNEESARLADALGVFPVCNGAEGACAADRGAGEEGGGCVDGCCCLDAAPISTPLPPSLAYSGKGATSPAAHWVQLCGGCGCVSVFSAECACLSMYMCVI